MKKISIIILAALLLTGCGASDSKSDSYIATEKSSTAESINGGEYGMSMEYTEDVVSEEVVENAAGNVSSENTGDISGVLDTVVTNGDATQKIIKTVSMTMQTKEFDEVLTAIGQKTKAVQGYTESSSIEGNNYYNDNGNRYASIVVRVPQEQLETFLEEVGGLGNVTSQNLNTENITLKYADTKSHKEALQVEYDRVLALLEKADTMETILTLESHLSDLRYQLNQYESTLRTYDNKVDYSTVVLEIYEVEQIIEVKEETFWDKIKNGLSDNLIDIGNAGANFIIWLIVSLPYFIIWGIIIMVIVLVIRKIRKKRRRKKEITMQEQQDKTKTVE